MFGRSDRKLFQSQPLLNQLSQNLALSSYEEQHISHDTSSMTDAERRKNTAYPSGQLHNENPIADMETRKSVAHPSGQLHNDSSIADMETRKSVAHPSGQLHNDSSIADLETQKSPLPVHSSLQLSKRKKRVPLSHKKKVVLLVVVLALLLPSIITIVELVNGAVLYSQIQGGVGHLQAAQNVFHSSDSDPAKYVDETRLHQAQAEIDAAHADFMSMSNKLDHDDAIGLVGGLLPAQITSARALGHIATDGTEAAQKIVTLAINLAPSIAPAFKKIPSAPDDTPPNPYITSAAFGDINKTLDEITPLVHDMATQAQGVSLASLPLSTKQRQQMQALLPLLPALDTGIGQAQGLRGVLGWLIGIDAQRSFLVEPMDRAELRPTGGFTGQFGELLVNGGHMGSLKLKNIGKYEEAHDLEGSPADPTVYPKVQGQLAPAPYDSWWPIDNFGMRDANLSPDFPTSAKIVMERYNYEFDRKVDGVIMFTPNLIKQVLHVTGPLVIPAYRETITEQNLEDRLHYYQLDNKGIRREELVEHVEDNQQARKLFTQRVTSTLMTTVMHLPPDKLLPMVNQMFQAMKTKDLEIYIANPQVEALIAKYGSTVLLDRSTSHDGLFVVQANLSASKASQYVTTDAQDTVTLDSKGGATHAMQITLDYQKKGDVYGMDTYRDYVRVYVPENSRLITGNGFDQDGHIYCGDAQSYRSPCAQDVYGDGSLVCSQPVSIGIATSYRPDQYLGRSYVLDVTGAPTNLQSDEAGRAMFGGWVVIPKDCKMKVTLSWYVPPMGQHGYSLLVQRQASVTSPLNITVKPAPGTCQGRPLNYTGMLDGEDKTFAVSQQGSQCSLKS